MLGAFLAGLLCRRLTIAAVSTSETGSRRPNNQDSVCADVAAGFFAVADGMGGAAAGDVASAIVCRRLAAAVAGAPQPLAERMQGVAQALDAAHAEITDYMREHGLARMGSTVAILLFDAEKPRRAVICHVGDSRVYLIRDGAAAALTVDHTVGCELGLYDGDGRNAADHVRFNHVLTRAVGIGDGPKPVARTVHIRRGDRFLICSDGVHDVLSTETIAMLTASGPLVEAQAKLAAEIVRCGAPDNYSFVLVGTDGAG